MNKSLLLRIAALAVLAGTIGCASQRIADPRIVLDPSASGLVRVLTVDYGETKGANPVVALSLQSTSGYTRHIEYRTVWFAPNGAALDSALSIWKPLTLNPREIGNIQAVAPRSNVSGFRVEIRKAP